MYLYKGFQYIVIMAPLRIMHSIKYELKKAFITYKVHFYIPIKMSIACSVMTVSNNKDKNIIYWPQYGEKTSREPMSLQFVKNLEPKCQPERLWKGYSLRTITIWEITIKNMNKVNLTHLLSKITYILQTLGPFLYIYLYFKFINSLLECTH